MRFYEEADTLLLHVQEEQESFGGSEKRVIDGDGRPALRFECPKRTNAYDVGKDTSVGLR